ncbi:MAG: HPF/RaiA family ribosome-associated protein [Polyangiaceae bacterium]|jgi:ribosomal subunit interface protein
MSVQITFRDFPPSDAIRAHVEKHVEKLASRFETFISFKVVLEAPHHHKHHGHAYRVRIDIVQPGSEIVIAPKDSEEGHSDLYAAIDDAFGGAERRLREAARVRRGEVKSHAAD